MKYNLNKKRGVVSLNISKGIKSLGVFLLFLAIIGIPEANGQILKKPSPQRIQNINSVQNSGAFSSLSFVERSVASFLPSNFIDSVAAPWVIKTGDINGDDHIDVVTASQADSTLLFYSGNGDGTFNDAILLDSLSSPVALEVNDFNNDGYDDVAAASFDQNDVLLYLYDDATAGFLSPILISDPDDMDGIFAIHSADLTGDGYNEIIVGSMLDDKLAYYLNDGNETFANQSVINSEADSVISVFTSDLDNDGDLDLLFTSGNDNKIGWHTNDGAGGFSTEKIISTDFLTPSYVSAGDVNNDGFPDVVAASEGDNAYLLFLNNGNGTFGSPITLSDDAPWAVNIQVADVNSDGDQDIIGASYFDNKIVWFKNNGDESFSAEKIITSQALGVQSIAITDVDNDNDIDILNSNLDGGIIEWQENLLSVKEGLNITAVEPNAAVPGDTVTIRGIGFSNTIAGNEVTFGFTSANIITAFDSILTVEVPSIGFGLTNLFVSTDSSSTLFSDRFTVLKTEPAHFGAKNSISTLTDGIWGAYASDLDGDGDLDVITGSANDDEISWFENTGDGNFGSQNIISTLADGAKEVRAADLDGDGDNDVISISFSDYELAWYENTGDGNFGSQIIISTAGITPYGLHTADIDNDGDIDVLTASYSDAEISLYLNNGDATFQTQSIISNLASGAWSVFTSDIDGDGLLDVLSASYFDDIIAWYKNNGNGTFGTQNVISTLADGAQNVFAADLDGDGLQDVLSASTLDDKIAWYKNNGDGTFGTQAVITTLADGVFGIHAADVDGDGDYDVLSASAVDDHIRWFENRGNGTFSGQIIIDDFADGAKNVFPADLDGDGDLDLISASEFSDEIAWYENILPPVITEITPMASTPGKEITIYGNFFSNSIVEFGNTSATIVSETTTKLVVEVPDMPAGFKTISITNIDATREYNQPFSILRHVNPNLETEAVVSTTADGARSVHSADLDGDGDFDLISASNSDDKIAWYENTGGGSFGTQQIITTSTDGAWDVYAADLDSDGDMDVISASFSDNKVAWYANDGSGGFSDQKIVTTAADGIRSVYSADLDNDGYMDVLSASAANDEIAWYKNNGDSTFTDPKVITNLADGAWDVFAADLDNDGFQDVLSASNIDDKIAWYKNNGDGTFDEQDTLTVEADGARSVFAADLNNDDLLDVISGSLNDDKIAVYINSGSGTFESQSVISTDADGVEHISAADINGDGNLDIVSASSIDGVLAWYPGNGDGTFNTQIVFSSLFSQANGLHISDINGDGDLDVIGASAGNDKISVFHNTGSTAEVSITDIFPHSGAPGAYITVYGSGFDPVAAANSVSFENEEGTIIEATSNKLIVEVPFLNPGPITLSVTNAGQDVEYINTFTVLKNIRNVSFNDNTVSTAADGANSILAADLNGDGLLDIISTSYIDDKIAWYPNESDTSFGEQIEISNLADGAEDVHAADLDGDGDLDLISASYIDNKIAWYENIGDGSFEAQSVISTSAINPKAVHAADLDSDGDLDVLSASYSDDKIAWYENNGDGTFKSQAVISTAANGAWDVYSADLDGDGDLDVLSASYIDYKIAWYENNGDGTFAGQVVISTAGTYPYNVIAADIDNDLDLDILAASYYDSEISLYENNGDGTFQEQNIISTQASGVNELYASDMDGDNDLDIISASFSDDDISWFENNGSGSFAPKKIVYDLADNAQSVYVADMDGDGDNDILSASYSDDKIAWHENTGTPIELVVSKLSSKASAPGNLLYIYGSNFADSKSGNSVKFNNISATIDTASSTRIVVTVPDIDPGFKTITVATESDTANYAGAFSVLGKKEAKFSYQSVISTSADAPHRVYAADLDNDGDQDILSASETDDKIAWYENEGDGIFGEQNIISTLADGARAVHAADLDGDGFMDVLSASYNDDEIAWYKNNGDGTFEDQAIISNLANGAMDIYTADIDGDGDLDVLSASYFDYEIAWYENLGNGNFGEQNIISTAGIYPYSVHAADMDNDGDMDVIAASWNDSEISFYKNNGKGSFQPQSIISLLANSPSDVYTSDIDGDGFVDVLSASYNDGEIAWYKNNGDGTYEDQSIITSNAINASSVYATDLDGDGDNDVISASNDNKIAFYLNDGSGSFEAQEVISTQVNNPYSVYAADLDNDGDMDILSASYTDDKIAWYENTEPSLAITGISPTAALPGANVTIYGSLFSNTATSNSVTFNGAEAAVVSADSSKLVVTVPEIVPGFAEVMVAAGGDTTTSNGIFTVLYPKEIDYLPESVITNLADGATDVHTADLDGDGDLDILSSSQNDYEIAWYENDGNGSFAAQVIISTAGTYPQKVHAADIDNDGDMDVLATSYWDDEISLYRNNGNGTFADQLIISTLADGVWDVFTADLDNDGDLDIISASINDDEIAWYENFGNGTFNTQQVISSLADYAISVYAEDVNGDGFIDVISGSSADDEVAWYKNNGDGTFDTQTIITNSADALQEVISADINGDGLPDVLSASSEDGKIAWYENTNDEESLFTSQKIIATVSGAYSLEAADIDGDGDMDVISASYNESAIYFHENTGEGSFREPEILSTDVFAARKVHAADLDGDGDLDILYASFSGDKIAWFENTEPPFSVTTIYPNAGIEGSSITFTGNGFSSTGSENKVFFNEQEAELTASDSTKLTVIVPDIDPGLKKVSVFNGTDSATYAGGFKMLHPVIPSFDSGESVTTSAGGARDVFAADLDGDGYEDLISASQYDYEVAWYKNNGDGSYSDANSLTTTAYGVTSVYAADMDNDGDMDILAASYDEYSVSLFINIGGAFSSEMIISTTSYGMVDIKAADIDTDGYLDILIASENSSHISWFKNNGNATFTSQFDISYNDWNVHSIDAADIDNDGDVDVISAISEAVVLHENQGEGAFDDGVYLKEGVGEINDVHISDIDSDGNLDILYTAYNSAAISWIKNNGNGFDDGSIPIFDDEDEFQSIFIYTSDLDGDGDRDIISANYSENQIAWYKNDGSESFEMIEISSSAIGAYSVFTTDADNDGDLDVLSASRDDNEIAIYENTGRPLQSYPTNLVASESDNSIELNWETPLSGFRNFNIYRAASAFTDLEDASKLNSALITDTTYSDTNIEEGSRYFYRVTAVDTTNDLESESSNLAVANYKVSSVFGISPIAGVSGDTISIYGTHFSTDVNDFEVLIDDSSPSVIAASKNSASFIIPDIDAGNYLISVTMSGQELMVPNPVTIIEEDPEKSGYFQNAVQVSDGSAGVKNISASDINLDGNFDILAPNFEDGSIKWVENDGDGTFTENNISSSVPGASAAVMADVDGDDDLDVIAASYSNNEVVLYKNNGSETFTLHSKIASFFNGVTSLAVTDINFDGAIDLIAASETGDKISWFQNDGTGTFGAENIITSDVDGVQSIELADINDDGYQDIISASSNDNTIALFTNNGDGTFSSINEISTSSGGAVSVSVGDIDGNGYLDILSASSTGDLIHWYPNFDNAFTTSVELATLDGAFDVKAADLDGDGDQDVVASTNTGLVVRYLNTNSGTFASPDTVITLASGETSISVADMDGNGTLDILAGSYDSGEVLLFRNVDAPPAAPTGFAANGTFGRITLSWNKNTESDIAGYTILRATDPAGDFIALESEIEDTFYVDSNLQNLQTYFYKVAAVDFSRNQIETEAIEINAISTQISSVIPSEGVSGDIIRISGFFSETEAENEVRFNGTEAEIISSNKNSIITKVPAALKDLVNIIVISEGADDTLAQPFQMLTSNDGTFSPAITETGFTGSGDLISADIDGEQSEDMELMVTLSSANGFRIFYPGARNPLESTETFNTTSKVKRVRQVNLGHNSYPDFVFISNSDNQFVVMERNEGGASLFKTTTIFVSNDKPEDIYPADMDGDGFNDVVIASSDDGKINWYKNLSMNGSMDFGDENIITESANGVISIAAEDFDNNGLIDVIAANEADDEVAFYQNNGDGFTATSLISNITGLVKVIASDIDVDGDLDVITGAADGIYILLNDGSGNFDETIELSSDISEVSDVYVADINADGNKDLLIATDGALLLSLNNDGVFDSTQLLNNEESGAKKVIAYDMNGDGKLDIASRANDSGTLQVFRNLQVVSLGVQDVIAGNNNIMLPSDAIEVQFNEDLSDLPGLLSLMDGTVKVVNNENMTFNTNLSIADSSLFVTGENLFGADTLHLNILSSQLSDASFGEFYIDVNENGTNDSEDATYSSSTFHTSMTGDFTRDFHVNFDDLVLFSDGWRNSNSIYETAPLEISDKGFPVARVQGNSAYDIDDLVSFIRFWNYSQDLNASKKEALASKLKLKEASDDKIASLPDPKHHSRQNGVNGFDAPDFNTPSIQVQHQDLIISEELQYISLEKQETAAAEYTSAENYTEVTYTFSLSHPDSVKALSLILDYDENAVEVTDIQDHGLFNTNKLNNTIFLSRIDSTEGLAILNIANFRELNIIDDKAIASVTFKSLKNQDADLIVAADLRIQGQPKLLQVAKQSVKIEEDLPQSFTLSQNYPNPFNPTTNIHYELAERSDVRLEIYDILGRKVETLVSRNALNPGFYKTSWNASRYASGMYIYVLNIKSASGKNHTFTKKMMLIK